MSRVYFIRDAGGERRVAETELPLTLGGAAVADVVIPGADEQATLAFIALADGHAYIQPADETRSPLFHNHERLTESRWLKSGDRVQLGEALLQWTVKGDQVFVDLRPAGAGLVPPTDAPPLEGSPAETVPVVEAPPPVPRTWRRVLVGLFVLLFTAAAFVLLATPVEVDIRPPPEAWSLDGFPPPLHLGDRWLVLPGSYRVRATREGYRPLRQTIEVPGGGLQSYRLELEELPGVIELRTRPQRPFRLQVDGSEVDVDNEGRARIARGRHRLTVLAERYLPASRELEVEGLGRTQQLSFELEPAWAGFRVVTQPAGARVRVDGEALGVTPFDGEILQGEHDIELSLDGYKPLSLRRSVTAGSALVLDGIRLQPEDGRLILASEPPGATVSVDGEYQGTTPLTLTLSSREEHRLQLATPGYRTASQRVTLEPASEKSLKLALVPEYGTLFLSTRPADATLVVDGKPVGRATRRLRLSTRPHRLEFRKSGYRTRTMTVTPQAGHSRTIEVVLQTLEEARRQALKKTITAPDGETLHLVQPSSPFRMGASRREAGRRANESRRLVQLTRPFYLGEREVTNAEFRRFNPKHRSGSAEGVSLDDPDRPVVNVGWDDAARYCNWLSGKAGLPPAYVEKQGHMVAVQPLTTGYRLPTEAEWAYVARWLRRKTASRYPWQGSYPPQSPVGNFADARIGDTLAEVVPGYDDGYRATAPVGQFPAFPPGFHDLGGNVAEWMHDFYAVYPGEAERLVRDPVGPARGEHHVVRGSGWRHGSITELRLSYRDYSRKPRPDLGFRIARYAM